MNDMIYDDNILIMMTYDVKKDDDTIHMMLCFVYINSPLHMLCL